MRTFLLLAVAGLLTITFGAPQIGKFVKNGHFVLSGGWVESGNKAHTITGIEYPGFIKLPKGEKLGDGAYSWTVTNGDKWVEARMGQKGGTGSIKSKNFPISVSDINAKLVEYFKTKNHVKMNHVHFDKGSYQKTVDVYGSKSDCESEIPARMEYTDRYYYDDADEDEVDDQQDNGYSMTIILGVTVAMIVLCCICIGAVICGGIIGYFVRGYVKNEQSNHVRYGQKYHQQVDMEAQSN
mmetsp:Transcript_41416/g.36620  ORF Transcript_41416/g.36620 Transcript_41416/m.36620 type:complete len:239 (+) Transcript_41416:99-815(+)